MGVHPNAALTIRQRQELQRLRREEGWTITRLASHFHVNRSTVFRWVQRTSADDRSPPPITHGRRIVTAAYQEAVIAYRHAHPTHGPQRIMDAVRDQFPTANTATMWRILHAAGLSQRGPKKTRPPTDFCRTTSCAIGHAGNPRHRWTPRAGVHNQSDSSANPHEILRNPR